jgi:protein-S-isoprenylcysteine O-methyltransferase Ste14
MNDLLTALGRKRTSIQKAWFFGLLGSVALSYLVIRGLTDHFFGINPIALQLAGWVGWFTWQGWLFPLNRERLLAKDPENAYRGIFFSNIVPGFSFWASQGACPAFYGWLYGASLTSSSNQFAAGVFCLASGLTILGLAFSTIGIGGAAFLDEYRDAPQPMIRLSVYSFIRHPLYLGGVLSTLGTGLLLDGPWSLALALVNVATLPVYKTLEDARLLRVFGDRYRDYHESVGGFLPKASILRATGSAAIRAGLAWLDSLALPADAWRAEPQPIVVSDMNSRIERMYR